jgi:WD40 repeat protein
MATPEGLSWDPADKAADNELQGLGAAIRAVACNNDAVITASSRPAVKVWKVAEAKVTEHLSLREGAVGCSNVEVADDGQVVAVCSDDGGIGLWDLRVAKRYAKLESTVLTAWKAKFLPSGLQLVSGGPSGVLCFWDLRTYRLESELSIGPGNSGKAEKGEDQYPERVKRRRRNAGATGSNAQPHGEPVPSPVYSLAVSRDGHFLGCGRGSGNVSAMRLDSREWIGDVVAHFSEARAPVRALAFDAASRVLLSGGDDNHICLLDAVFWARRRADGFVRSPQLERFSAHRGWVTSLSSCPDPARNVVVTTSWDATVKLWDYRTHRLLRSYKEHSDSVFASAFAPGSGRFFATVGADATIAVYAARHETGMAGASDAKDEAMPAAR